jgi:glycosyltransferase involved in cell wall biosynthesis
VKILGSRRTLPGRARYLVEFLKKRLEAEGHRCVVINIGTSRHVPSTEYETVLGGLDFARKVWRHARQGFVVHAHANGDAIKGLLLALAAELIGLACGRRCYLTFHAGAIQRYFPREKSWRLAPLFWLLFQVPRRIICNSETVKAKIRGYGVPADKIVPIAAFKAYMGTCQRHPRARQRVLRPYPNVVFGQKSARPLFFPADMVDALATVVSHRRDVGLMLCGLSGHEDEGVWVGQERIRHHGLDPHSASSRPRPRAFLTTLRRSTIYGHRSPTRRASSVLESLALGVPVVACGTGGPAGVLTYTKQARRDGRRISTWL